MANPQLEKGYTKISNEILEALGRTRIAGEARQVLDVIFRKTYGFNKKRDRISLSQFVLATGLKRSNVCRSIKKLIDIKMIIKIDTPIGEVYLVQKDFDQWKPLSKKIIVRGVSKVITDIIKNDNKVVSKMIHTKERNKITKEKTSFKKKIDISKFKPDFIK